jgi:hypothetical protein
MKVGRRAPGPAYANLQWRKPREVWKGRASDAMGIWRLSCLIVSTTFAIRHELCEWVKTPFAEKERILQLVRYVPAGSLCTASAEQIFPRDSVQRNCFELALYTARDHDCISNRIGSGIRSAMRMSSRCPAPATNQPDGQNFTFAVGQITFRTHAILSPRKGRWPSSPNVGMGCGGHGGVEREVCSQGGFRERATARRTYDAEAYGEVVWS